MKITKQVQHILANYQDKPGVLAKLYHILMHGRLGGTGKLVILPVDQGFEHGPTKSFAVNPSSFDPDYHIQLAIDAGLSAYAAPIGMLQAASVKFAGRIPTILKMNSNNSLNSATSSPDQAITASVKDALELGCLGVGITIYPASNKSTDMIEEAREIIREAKSYGLAAIVWSYPRGGHLSPQGQTAIDVCAYAAHIAALIGADIIKVKPPTSHIEFEDNKKLFANAKIKIDTLSDRVKHVMQSCFASKRLVVFSGGAAKDTMSLLEEVKQLKAGGASGSIIGRNSFQRERGEATALLNQICDIYLDT